MSIYAPFAENRQISGKSTTIFKPRIINVHTMAGTIESAQSFFSRAGNPYSHFGLDGEGSFRQWQDLQYRAASDLDGNGISISIETEDSGPGFPKWSGSDVPRWTDKQAKSLVNGIAWLCIRFGIPPILLTTSLPGQTGLSYHRLGIDPYRVDGGIRYSKARAKACPGDRRIEQFKNEIVPGVRAIVLGEGLIMDNEVKKAFDAIQAQLDAGKEQSFANRTIESLKRVEDMIKDLRTRVGLPEGFLAVPEDYQTGEPVFYVANNWQSKVQFSQNGPLHELIKFLNQASSISVSATRLPQATLDEIPTVAS